MHICLRLDANTWDSNNLVVRGHNKNKLFFCIYLGGGWYQYSFHQNIYIPSLEKRSHSWLWYYIKYLSVYISCANAFRGMDCINDLYICLRFNTNCQIFYLSMWKGIRFVESLFSSSKVILKNCKIKNNVLFQSILMHLKHSHIPLQLVSWKRFL